MPIRQSSDDPLRSMATLAPSSALCRRDSISPCALPPPSALRRSTWTSGRRTAWIPRRSLARVPASALSRVCAKASRTAKPSRTSIHQRRARNANIRVTNQDRSFHVISLRNRTLGFARTGLPLLLAAALMFLLIGCANVANLLLARTFAQTARNRSPDGAGRWTIENRAAARLRKSPARSRWRNRRLRLHRAGLETSSLRRSHDHSATRHCPRRLDRVRIHAGDLGHQRTDIRHRARSRFCPRAIPLSRSGNPERAASSAQHRNRLRSSLVVGEVAVAVILVMIGGLLTGSFVKLLRTNPGFEPDRVLASIIIAAGDQYTNASQPRDAIPPYCGFRPHAAWRRSGRHCGCPAIQR